MNLVCGLHNLKSQFTNGCVATVGNFDGIHLGHQQILMLLKKKSEELKIPAVVIIFEPQPEEFFTSNKTLRLTSLREKVRLFSQYGIKNVLVLAFNSCFAELTAARFIEKFLFGTLHIKYFIGGDDFSFGHDRVGDFALISKYADSLGLKAERVPSFVIGGVRVSSSLIRRALLQDDLETAVKFLGRPYLVSGRVVHGEHLGRDLGFPTANIYLPRRELLLNGVYAVKVYNVEEKCLYGIANCGFCPTVSGKCKTFEIYIFDFSADLYGKKIAVEFCKRIRNEQKFVSLDNLKLQIKKDIKKAKEILKC